MKKQVRLVVNGHLWEGEVDVGTTLLDLLRDDMGLTGAKKGCDGGECGACTVLLNGQPVNSCLVLAVSLDGDIVETIEGLDDEESRIIKESYVATGAVQCGFCSPGMIIATKGLLNQNPNPTVEEIETAFVGHLCRCTGYARTVEAVQRAVRLLNEPKQN
ncbi:Nicotinate dehydrogenase small FeS subunit [Pelotomaculum schinkii]|uniref:Nicotinate dehydrogenase small FeS subunit n=1 Tax=Pelotomaculum schinkii TaxID=78350 RepID=A0A4Y7R683_9FIRM|nr:(2Fe-2S)-binding protein [Pelotomaculum schinkii]TEB04455.1 Nicotinate dehydrogenase small FeS subunit [Pelotomaculum schinkii]